MEQHIENKLLAAVIDYQLLRPEAGRHEIDQACESARRHGFRSVWVHGSRVIQAVARLEESAVKVTAVVGFPLGAMEPDVKRYETEAAIDSGAQEINVAMNLGSLRDADDPAILRELRDVVEAADERPVGVFVDCALLTEAEQARGCGLIQEAGARLVILSAGFQSGGASVEGVKRFRSWLAPKFGLTAASGTLDRPTALGLVTAGATRIATPAAEELVSSD